MRLVSHQNGFGRVLESSGGRVIVPMGRDIVAYLAGEEASQDGSPVPYDQVQLCAPVPRPGKIVCVGLNYRDHAAETGKPVPEEPVLFAKFANSVVGSRRRVHMPQRPLGPRPATSRSW